MIFSHGKESGPWGTKITAMAGVVRDVGLETVSVDYRGMGAGDRVTKLITEASLHAGGLVLVGSSMGGHVSAAAAVRVRARGLFLLAPAFYMPGFEPQTPQDVTCPTAIVHGWSDAIVPVANSVRWGAEHRAALHILDSDHRLENRLDDVCALLRAFLSTLATTV